ncbi:MAG: ABC transporter ATP-binding protein [Lachnospiraceae bacterium]|nr:ABC transporter ATP-binding protein [Lachnospiraceae bacterium]
MYINVKDVSVYYTQGGGTFEALKNVSLSINQGEFVCLLGPSGCGKSTLLNLLAGFEKPTKGEILIGEKQVTAPAPKYLTIFQNYGLFPWRTVLHNVELGLEAKGMRRQARRQQALKYLEMVGLAQAKDKKPCQLSGGMQQRVAIARALAAEPEILFMDEPFGALDAITRMKLQDDILRICKEEGKTIIFVTHDIEEAVFLADRIVVMEANPGSVQRIVEVEMPHERDRTSDDFIVVRDKVFALMHLKKDKEVEYYI